MSKATISVEELRARLDRGDPVTVLDIRPEEDHDEWHIPGSLNIPLYDHLDEDEIPQLDPVEGRDQPVVTVCPRGITAVAATRALQDRGIQALTLEGGLRAWTLAWNTAELEPTPAGTTVLQIRRTGKGCLSYIVASGDQAAVVDPALDPELFMELARERGWTITHVIETHVHADHLSRAKPLAEATGAVHLLPDGAPVAFAHEAIRGGDTIELGSAHVEVLATPGHTPESITLLVDDHALLTGDTLFAAGVGRPDLEAGDGVPERARALHASLQRLLALPPELVVLPAHAPGPLAFDGRIHSARLGELPARIDVLGLEEAAFVETVMDRLPENPPNHGRIVKHNRAGTLPESDVIELEAGANRCAAG